MIKKFYLIFLAIYSLNVKAQDIRFEKIKNQIESVISEAPGLSQKVNVKIKHSTLSEFLLAVSEVHKVNISVAPSLNQIMIVNNFSDVNVSDLLIFLCKEYNLAIDFTGNILAIKPYVAPVEILKEKMINVNYKKDENLLSLNLKDDNLYEVFRKITDESGKNLVFAPGMENKLLTGYIKDMPFDDAVNKLSYANNLAVTKTKDNFYVFDNYDAEVVQQTNAETNINQQKKSRPIRSRKSNFFFNIIDSEKKIIEVDFENTPISNIVYDIANELGLDIFMSTPLEGAGNATVKSKKITFNELLDKIFESKTYVGNDFSEQQTQNGPQAQQSLSEYTYTVKNNMYFFGLKNQLTLRNVKNIVLMHRSIEILSDPSKEGRSAGRLTNSNTFSNYSTGNNLPSNNNNNFSESDSSDKKGGGSLLSIFPKEILNGLDVKVDMELNSFIVNGPSENIDRFESFVKYIDKPVPVVLIEVMILEVNRSAIVETGISAGIGDKQTITKGSVFPTPDITIGAQTINKIINNFDGFGSLNIGNVVPNFYLSLKALESNGSVNIRSTPRLSTLNGHRAFLSIGETTYYVVTNQNFYGSQIPQTSEIKNYQPIDAELSLTIRPLISGDGQITMDIKVIQSSFNGQKVDKDAPPGINSREFTSIIRVKDQDLIVLGGLEEKVKNDSGSGVPLLSRIPVIKWFFSSRKREDSKKKLSIIIKPSAIY